MTSEYTDFDDLTVDEAKEHLADADESDLRDVLVYERSHKDRVTLTRWIESRLGIDEVDEDEAPEDDEPDVIRVTNGEFTGYVAGETFRNPHETRVLPNNERTRQGLETGKITRTLHQPDQ